MPKRYHAHVYVPRHNDVFTLSYLEQPSDWKNAYQWCYGTWPSDEMLVEMETVNA